MKSSQCIFCGPAPNKVLFHQRGTDTYFELISDVISNPERCWRICLSCGFVFRSPVLESEAAELLYQRYEKDAFRNTTPDAYFDHITSLRTKDSENAQKVLWIKNTLEHFAPDWNLASMRVLDVGCGGGTLLYTLRELMGAEQISGVELNEAYACLARRRLGADVRNQAHEPGLFDGDFDLIVNTKVLEHVEDPVDMVVSIARDLKADGWAFLEVPDIQDLFTLPPDHERFWIPHVWYFSQSTLTELAAIAGLRVIVSRTVVSDRGRAYLQMLTQKSTNARRCSKPFDDPYTLIERMKEGSRSSG